jgi:hypothetical protein
MGLTDCPETSVRYYHYTLRNSADDLSSHLLRREAWGYFTSVNNITVFWDVTPCILVDILKLLRNLLPQSSSSQKRVFYSENTGSSLMRKLSFSLPNYVQSRPTFQICYCRTRYLYYYIDEIRVEKLKHLATETYGWVSYTLVVHHE